MTAEWIPLEEYAKHLGVMPNAVSYAIDTGRIPKSAVSHVINGGRKKGGSKKIIINKPEADTAWIDTHNETHNKAEKAATARIRKARIKATPETQEYEPVNGENSTFNKAQTQEKVAKAGIAALEFHRLQGSVVLKDVVYKQLFEAGTELRDAIMAVPDRVTAEICAAGNNQQKIRTILIEALASSLEGLTDLYTKKLG